MAAGFQPGTHRTRASQPAMGLQRLANGGIISALKGKLFGPAETVSEKYARQDAELAAKSVKSPPPAQTPALAPNTIAGYAGMTAMKAREKMAGLKDGGPITGPGTGTSDSIDTMMRPGTYIMPADSTRKIGEGAIARMSKVPVSVSNGEYELTPEQVHAVGLKTLDGVKNQTHTPTSGAIAKLGMQKRADGGLVNEHPKFNALMAPLSPSDMANNPGRVAPIEIYQSTPAVGNTSVPAMPDANASTAPTATRRPMPRMLPAATGTPALQSAITAPTQGPVPGPIAQKTREAARQQIPTAESGRGAEKRLGQTPDLSYMDNNKAVGDQVKESWGKGQYGQALGQLASGSVGMVTTPLIDGAVRGGAAAWEGAKNFGRGLLSMDASTPGPDASSSNPTQTDVQRGGTSARAAEDGQVAGPASTLNDPKALNGIVGKAVDGAPGVVKLQGGMFKNPMFTDDPVRAANEFNQIGIAPGAGSGPAAVGAGAAGPIRSLAGGSPSMDAALSQARFAAAQRGDFAAVRDSYQQSGGTFAGQTQADTQMQDLQSQMRGAKGKQAERLLAMMGQLTAQKSAQNAQQNATNEFGLKKQAGDTAQTIAGFQARSAAQSEQLRNTLIDPNATPEQRKVAQRSLAALSGKTMADRMQTVNLPDTIDTLGGVVRGGQALVRTLEDGTVEQVPIGAQKQQQPLAENKQAIDIKNNTSMTREQKVAALAKLGY